MGKTAWHFENDTLILEVRVQPRARRDEIAGIDNGRIKLRVSAPPVDNAANQRLKNFLAKEFDVSSGRVRIIRGHAGRYKRIAVDKPNRLPRWLREDSTI